MRRHDALLIPSDIFQYAQARQGRKETAPSLQFIYLQPIYLVANPHGISRR